MDNNDRLKQIQEDMRVKPPEEILARVKAIAIACGIADERGMCVDMPAFKRHVNLDAHKFTGKAGYKVYFGVPGWKAIGLIEYFPLFAERNKVKAIEQFWGDLKMTINDSDLEIITDMDIRVRQKFSIGWE